MRRSALLAFTSIGLVSGCGEILGVTDWVVDDGGAIYDGDALVTFDAPQSGDGGLTCAPPRVGGMNGVLVQNEFCIDSTESTVALYQTFLNDLSTDPSKGQPPECAWNTDYGQQYPDDNVNHDPNYPITVIDWCDALAFCTYWGKHLCGNRFDAGGLDLDATDKTGQWYTACTNGNTSQFYPYGDTYDASACNTGFNGGGGEVEAVPTSQSCQGGVPGLYDMSGNVQEWTNQCESTGDAEDDTCFLRGGPYSFPGVSNGCTDNGGSIHPPSGAYTSRSGANTVSGIRCCWEP